jgi:capsular exopolysaccharide synthesis family protein
MEPIDYLRLLRRRWRLLVAAVLVAGAVAWVTAPSGSGSTQVTFEATHILLRDTASATPPPALAQVALFVETGEVPTRVAERLGDASPAALVGRVDVLPDEASGSVEITASAPSREEAAAIANAFGEETLAFFGEEAQDAQADAIQAANDEVTTLQAEIDEIEDDISAAEAAGSGTGVLEARRDSRIREYGVALDRQAQVLAQPPPAAGYVSLAPATPELATARDGGFETPRSRPVRVALAALVGLALGLAAVLIAERVDPRIHTREAAIAAFGLPVVAEVPRADPAKARGKRPIAVIETPFSAVAEGYRSLRAAVLLSPLSQLRGSSEGETVDEPHVVLVTSPTPGDGKTTTVANLAAAFAETGRSVLVLSCDFRRPELHRHFDVPDRPGLSDVLAGTRQLEDVARKTPVNGVYVAPDGGGLKALGDLAAHGPDLIDRARQLADVVLVDTAPVLATNDASELIPCVDAVVVVCRSGGTRAEAARRARALLDRLDAPLVGLMLVGVSNAEASYAGYYTSSTTEGDGGRPGIPLRRRAVPEEPALGAPPAPPEPNAISQPVRPEPTASPQPAQPEPIARPTVEGSHEGR